MGTATAQAGDRTLRPPVLRGVLPGPRRWLRAHPRLQGAVVAPSGLGHSLPHLTGGLYVLLYHDIEADYVIGLRRHVETLLDRGRFLTWEQSLSCLQSEEPLPGPQFCLTFDDGHKEWVDRVLPLLQELNLTATFFLTTDKVVEGRSEQKLTWKDCRALVDAGMHIGSHTVTHRRLSGLRASEAEHEIAGSKDQLEQHLGLSIQDFSVPFGLPGLDYGPRELELVRAHGYRSCVTALPGRMSPGHPVMEIRRCGLSPAWPLMAVRRRVHE